jgi:hypothetical protein
MLMYGPPIASPPPAEARDGPGGGDPATQRASGNMLIQGDNLDALKALLDL